MSSDGYGYYATADDHPQGPEYNWHDISGTGLLVGSGDEADFSINVNLDGPPVRVCMCCQDAHLAPATHTHCS